MVGWLGWYRYRRKIAIDHTKISSALTDFPLLLYIATAGVGGSGITDADLIDVLVAFFSLDRRIAVTTDDGLTQCPVEVEYHPNNGGVDDMGFLWVKVPSVSSLVDTVLYIYYDQTQPDNDAFVGEIGSAVGKSVWDANFQGVYHFSDFADDLINAIDSTANAVNGTKTNVAEDWKIGVDAQFPSAVSKIDLGNPAGFDQANIMVEAWIKTVQNYAEDGRIVTIGSGATNKWMLTMNLTSNKAVMSNTTASHATPASNLALNDGAWYHVVGTTNPEAIYVNGVLQTATRTDSWSFEANSKIGSRGTARQFIGYMDEVRVSDKNRGIEYALASYHSGNDSLVTYDDREEMLCTAKATFIT